MATRTRASYRLRSAILDERKSAAESTESVDTNSADTVDTTTNNSLHADKEKPIATRSTTTLDDPASSSSPTNSLPTCDDVVVDSNVHEQVDVQQSQEAPTTEQHIVEQEEEVAQVVEEVIPHEVALVVPDFPSDSKDCHHDAEDDMSTMPSLYSSIQEETNLVIEEVFNDTVDIDEPSCSSTTNGITNTEGYVETNSEIRNCEAVVEPLPQVVKTKTILLAGPMSSYAEKEFSISELNKIEVLEPFDNVDGADTFDLPIQVAAVLRHRWMGLSNRKQQQIMDPVVTKFRSAKNNVSTIVRQRGRFALLDLGCKTVKALFKSHTELVVARKETLLAVNRCPFPTTTDAGDPDFVEHSQSLTVDPDLTDLDNDESSDNSSHTSIPLRRLKRRPPPSSLHDEEYFQKKKTPVASESVSPMERGIISSSIAASSSSSAVVPLSNKKSTTRKIIVENAVPRFPSSSSSSVFDWLTEIIQEKQTSLLNQDDLLVDECEKLMQTYATLESIVGMSDVTKGSMAICNEKCDVNLDLIVQHAADRIALRKVLEYARTTAFIIQPDASSSSSMNSRP